MVCIQGDFECVEGTGDCDQDMDCFGNLVFNYLSVCLIIAHVTNVINDTHVTNDTHVKNVANVTNVTNDTHVTNNQDMDCFANLVCTCKQSHCLLEFPMESLPFDHCKCYKC